jgi:hydroxymethylglutaryl-CoA lyase
VLAIVANERGAKDALQYEVINILGYPFSISPTFQLRNANSTIEESWERLMHIQSLCEKKSTELVVYVSMGFGNPYGDAFGADLVMQWVQRLAKAGIRIISLADTVGLATAETVAAITGAVIRENGAIDIGVHLHSTAANWQGKMNAAYSVGCRRFDGALKGFGGCPMADDALVGNMNSELMIPFLESHGHRPILDDAALNEAMLMAAEIFIQ